MEAKRREEDGAGGLVGLPAVVLGQGGALLWSDSVTFAASAAWLPSRGRAGQGLRDTALKAERLAQLPLEGGAGR